MANAVTARRPNDGGYAAAARPAAARVTVDGEESALFRQS
jgi:hypothetical protein